MNIFDDDEKDDESERPEFYAAVIGLMDMTPGNFDHAEGDPGLVMTVMRKDMSVEQMAFTIAEARTIATKTLVALATYEDTFAKRLLEDHFSTDREGTFVWPRSFDDLHEQG